MIQFVKCCIILAVAGALVPAAATRGNVIFDFDTGTPVLTTNQHVPFWQTSDDITAHFNSPPRAFSVQNADSMSLISSQFSGNYLYTDHKGSVLDISFHCPLTGISLTFATIELQDAEPPTAIILTARRNSSAGPCIGWASAYGLRAGDTFPTGTLLFNSDGQWFNRVQIAIAPNQPLGAAAFIVDNITVTTVVPEPTSLIFLGVGAMGLFVRQRL